LVFYVLLNYEWVNRLNKLLSCLLLRLLELCAFFLGKIRPRYFFFFIIIWFLDEIY
jgi:hypothetical protein